MHDDVAKIIYLELKKKLCNVTGNQADKPYYEYVPEPAIETATHKLYWDRTIWTDREVQNNRPDIIVFSKQERKVQLIDIAVPGIKNIHSTHTKKI